MATEDSGENAFARLNRLSDMLETENERGIVLLTASCAEELLGRLLIVFLRQVRASNDLVEGFNAPLGTFSSRIKATYALGVISPEQYQDLELLRKIRNHFAHKWDEITNFDTPEIADRIKQMTYSRIDKSRSGTLIEKLKQSMTCLLLELELAIVEMPKRGGRLKDRSFHVSLFPDGPSSQGEPA